MTEFGFNLRMFFPQDDKNCCIIERTDYQGFSCYVIDRKDYMDFSVGRELLFNQPAVYFLINANRIYIGEADPFAGRIRDHLSSKDWFNKLIFFTGQNFNKAKIQYLEASLIKKVWKNKSLTVDNKKRQNLPNLPDHERSDAERTLHYIIDTLYKINLNYFEETAETITFDEETIQELQEAAKLFFCKGRGITASAVQSDTGIIVKAGSYMVKDEAPSISSSCRNIRQGLLASGILIEDVDKLKLTKDHYFSSPSSASGTVLGRSSNGQIDWVDENKIAIKEFLAKTS